MEDHPRTGETWDWNGLVCDMFHPSHMDFYVGWIPKATFDALKPHRATWYFFLCSQMLTCFFNGKWGFSSLQLQKMEDERWFNKLKFAISGFKRPVTQESTVIITYSMMRWNAQLMCLWLFVSYVPLQMHVHQAHSPNAFQFQGTCSCPRGKWRIPSNLLWGCRTQSRWFSKATYLYFFPQPFHLIHNCMIFWYIIMIYQWHTRVGTFAWYTRSGFIWTYTWLFGIPIFGHTQIVYYYWLSYVCITL